MKKIILASRSPRRETLLRQVGLDFSIIASDADENIPQNVPPEEYVKSLSRLKAESIASETSEPAVIIGADTIVVKDGQIMGKPSNEKDAYEMLKRLQGSMHFVFTGVTATEKRPDGQTISSSFAEITSVFMRTLSDDEIYSYIATGEPMDKAGAYAIQDKGSLLVEKIEGDFYNVVGLPIMKTYLLLKKLGAV